MPNHPELSNQMKAYRTAANLTQTDLAATIGVSRKTINTVENGVFIPSTILALKLAKALNVSVEDLFQLKHEGGS